jgi:SAM-dependent methyltransferase
VHSTLSPAGAPSASPACGAAAPARLHPRVIGDPPLHSEVMECTPCDHRFLAAGQEQQRRAEAGYERRYAGHVSDPFFARVIRDVVAGELVPRKAPPARVLDVGCGAGEFMQAAVEAGYRVQGVDVSAAAAERCRARGLDARAGDFLTRELEGGYGMITPWDVAEHLRDPYGFAARARALLAPGGVLLLKIPGFGRRTFAAVGSFNRLAGAVLGAPLHIQYFTPRSLQALLDRAGYARVEWLPPRRFRQRPSARGLRRLAGRALTFAIAAAAGNRNLFVVAHP